MRWRAFESTAANPRRGGASGWLGDFAWRGGAIEIRKTGIRLKFDFDLVWEVACWAVYFAVLAVAAAVARVRRPRPLAIWYAPDRPRPWYLLRGAALWAGIHAAASPSAADAAFYFDDTTRGAPPAFPGAPAFNHRCVDISKGHVARVFATVFGYPLSLDPEGALGDIVEKAERNGVHDGRIVTAPLRPRAGYVYQKLIDTTDEKGLVHDLRTPCAGGTAIVVWEKTKPAQRRFAIHNSRAALRDPQAIFSPVELERISAFTARIGLDWGGLDILRDRNDGRIYIVDVNKTDLGPVIALSWLDKIRSMNRLSRALSSLVRSGARSDHGSARL